MQYSNACVSKTDAVPVGTIAEALAIDPTAPDILAATADEHLAAPPANELANLFANQEDPMRIYPAPLLTRDTHPTYPDAFIDRLNVFTTYSTDSPCYYALNQLPATATWGNKSPNGRENEFLTLVNRPVVVMIVAELVSAQFLRDGRPVRRVNVQLKPVVDSDELKARYIISHFTEPQIREYPAYSTSAPLTDVPTALEAVNGVWAIKWNSPYSQSDPEHVSLLFLV